MAKFYLAIILRLIFKKQILAIKIQYMTNFKYYTSMILW